MSPRFAPTAIYVLGGAAFFGLGIAADRLVFTSGSGDPLAFAGAVFGAGATVVGSWVVANMQIGAASRDRYRLINEALDEAQRAFETAKAASRRPVNPGTLTQARNEITRSLVWLQQIRTATPINSVPLLKAFSVMAKFPTEDMGDLDAAINGAISYPNERNNVAEGVKPMIEAIKDARMALNLN